MTRSRLILFPVLLFILSPGATAHGFIKAWASDDQNFQKAQKQPLTDTAFRNAPSNIGWIGSQFIDTPAFTCGASGTPKDKVAPPSGTLFSATEQSAKKTLPVKAGGKVSLIVGGNPGEGFPHQSGHMLVYLGYCGKSPTACQNFDASQTQYHRIQAEVDGIKNKLVKQYDSQQDGNRWDVPIPQDLADGSYIFRVEMIAFGQSSPEEGRQDQYYVFCGQIAVEGGTGSGPVPNDGQPTAKFPGAYKPGNIDPKSLPTITGTVAIPSDTDPKLKVQAKSTADATNKSQEESPDSEAPPKSLCADRCYRKKLTELQNLAPNCSADQFGCLCKSESFVKAYQNCCNDHCKGINETQIAVTEIYNKCASATQSSNTSDDSKSTPDSSGKKNGSSASEKQSSADHRSEESSVLNSEGKEKNVNAKQPSACNGVCYKAKTTEAELHHLAPPCSTGDLDCLCRSHKWVCSYAQCSRDNCASSADADKAIDEIYAICGARLSSPNRSSLPSTDYIPVNPNPSSATRLKSNNCSRSCLRKISSSSKCTSPDNLQCICKSHADVCAWAKCAEDQCFDEVDAIRLASDQIYDQCSKQ